MNLEEAKQKFKEAVDFYENHEFDQATEIFEQLYATVHLIEHKKINQFHTQITINLAHCYERKKKLEEALYFYQSVPKDRLVWYAEAQFNSAGIYYQLNKFDQAITVYQKIPGQSKT